MKTFFLAVSTALTLAFVSTTVLGQAPAAPALRVGYISVQRIFAGSNEGKAEMSRLNTAQQEKAADLKVKQQAIEATRQRMATAADPAALTQLQQQELQQRADLERAAVQAQNEMQTLQRETQLELLTRIKTVVEALAKAQNLQLVLHGDQAIVWTEPGLDLTAAVIERLNASPPKP